MIFLDNTILWLWLTGKSCISRNKQHKLLHHFGDIESIYKANLSDYYELKIFSDEELNLLSGKKLDKCHEMLERLGKLNARVITIDNDSYPDFLRTIHTPPTVLYSRGTLKDFNNRFMIAMVGTRKATNYGKTCAYNIARELSRSGTVVVSGMAMGIDAKSHEGALSGGSPTVAVIGTGVDIAYPSANSSLMKSIMANGAVLSEYPLGTPAEKYHFPERNRIISGLCHGTLVVEADFKSGSLITAKYANEQNRDVFAVPGNVNSVYSKGTNYLLKDGAHFVSGAEDILKFYKYDGLIEQSSPPAEETTEINTDMSDPEKRILSALGEEAVHTDTICQLTGLDIGTVNANLLMLELTGKIIKLAGGYYSAVK